jgi:hypothetical protein
VTSQIVIHLPLAHLGHWYFFPLYLAPVLVVLYTAIRTFLEERRKGREEASKRREDG